MRRTVGTLLSLVAVVFLAMTPTTAQQTPSDQSHGGRFHRHGPRAIPSHYIVVLDRDVAGQQRVEASTALNDRDVADLLPDWAGTVTRRFDHALNGFAAQMTEQQAEQLSDDPRVAFVEEDSVVEALVTQSNPPWGLDRIGQRDLPLNATYTYTTTGAGVNAYIIDTGIRRTHSQFLTNGVRRALFGFDAVGDGQNGNDCNGHGTHVSGTVGGNTFGVAKAVTLWAVRVLSCNGSGTTRDQRGNYTLGAACPECRGHGRVRSMRRGEVTIPPGVTDGKRIRLAGQGAAGSTGTRGDLFFVVRIKPHPEIDRQGNDLYVDVAIPFTVAALGGEVNVHTLNGDRTLQVPAGVQSGQKIRISGQGMPALKGQKSGDMYARVKVSVPRDLSPRERELISEVAKIRGDRVK